MPKKSSRYGLRVTYDQAVKIAGSEDRLVGNQTPGTKGDWKKKGVPAHIVAVYLLRFWAEKTYGSTKSAPEAPPTAREAGMPYANSPAISRPARRKARQETKPEVARIGAKLIQVALDADAEEKPEEIRYLVRKLTENVEDLIRRRFADEQSVL